MDFVMLVVFISYDSLYQSKCKLTSWSNFVFIMFDFFFLKWGFLNLVLSPYCGNENKTKRTDAHIKEAQNSELQ